MLSAAELASMRDTQETNLPDVVTIYDLTVTADVLGGETETWVARALGVQGRLGQATERELATIVSERIDTTTTLVLTLAHGTPIDRRDRVTVRGVTYQVLGVQEGDSYQTAVRCAVQEVG